MRKIVLDLNDRRPAWAMPPWVSEEIRTALPEGWKLHAVETQADGSGDGMVNLDPALVEAAREAEIYLGYGVPAALLREGKGLRWVHSGAAGVKGSLTPEMLSSPVLFTNSKGIHGPPMADTALGMILFFSRGLDFGVAAKGRGRWDNGSFYAADTPLREIAHSTVGIFGYGGIGREVAKRLLALGATVMAFDRGLDAINVRGTRFEEDAFYGGGPERTVGGSGGGGAAGVEPLYGPDGFSRLLEASDFLVLTAPETPETSGVFDSEALSRMKPDAVLINISRGRLVDEDALVDALSKGVLRGAGLDVFAEEPLPDGHPLWDLPNVVITPHVSAVTRHFWRRQTDLILENFRRYLAGETLLNLVDKEAGF
jgi:phosphoglycerate dehydrogenase-like enzyme